MDTNTPRNGYGWIRRQLELLVSGCLLAAMLPLAIAQEPAGDVPYIPTVLITGANRGLGLEFTRQYVDRGWRVIATARRPEAADDLTRQYAGRVRAGGQGCQTGWRGFDDPYHWREPWARV